MELHPLATMAHNPLPALHTTLNISVRHHPRETLHYTMWDTILELIDALSPLSARHQPITLLSIHSLSDNLILELTDTTSELCPCPRQVAEAIAHPVKLCTWCKDSSSSSTS